MEIKGNVHCFFEQSGTFKNEFKKLGINAFDYDIQNNFGETDYCEDLFLHIENAYSGGASLFDSITQDDLIIAFFPCIYFETVQQMYFSFDHSNLKHLDELEKVRIAIERLNKRTKFHTLLYKLVAVCEMNKIRLIIENPCSGPNYLVTGQNFPTPTIIDKDRTRRGDFFKKPTAYWFFGCRNTNLFTPQYTPKEKRKNVENSKPGKQSGICSEERSMISPEYAHNFICDNIIGMEQDYSGKQLSFNFEEFEN